jgi:hypothetical protein
MSQQIDEIIANLHRMREEGVVPFLNEAKRVLEGFSTVLDAIDEDIDLMDANLDDVEDFDSLKADVLAHAEQIGEVMVALDGKEDDDADDE